MNFKEWLHLTEIATDTWGTQPVPHPDVIAAYYNGPLPGNIDNSNKPPVGWSKTYIPKKKRRYRKNP